ncbi:SH3 domain-containing protein [Sphaerothrix gracilis]|uniref:SH3 domain-containing protein n=1 Tax=Sphaerothrix gracilis TaxID=3151835 RepID=UPI0031FD75D1
MKKAQLWITGIVGAAAVAGGGIAVMQSQPDTPDVIDSVTAPGEESVPADEAPLAESPTAPDTPTTPQRPDPKLSDFPHKRLELTDEVSEGSEFDQFRDRLQKAIQDRDTEFVRSILPAEGLTYGFGGPLRVDDMDLNQEDGWFWQELEKMMALESCETSEYPPVEAGGTVWVCPNTTQAFYRQYPAPADAEGIEHEFSKVMVMGQNVNVRAAPNTDSPVVGILSNELVEFDQAAATRQYEANPDARPGAIKGWTPVILPNDVQGYVYNRYAYAPLDPRGLFENVNGQWQLIRVLAGD